MVEYRLPYDGDIKITCLYAKKGSWKCGWHTGVDFVGLSDKNIRAIADGTVIFKSRSTSYGNYLRIRHDDGNISLYAHMSSIKVSKGDSVKAGQIIGVEGATGNANGAHLHMEIHNGSYKYPTGKTPETATWMRNPCTVLGIVEKTGKVQKIMPEPVIPEVVTPTATPITDEQFAQLMADYREEVQAKPGSAWSKDAREWAVDIGLFAGDDEADFKWCDTLSREQAAVLFQRFYDLIWKG